MANIHLRVSDEKKNQIIINAKKENLTMTAFIINAVNEHIKHTSGGK